jgi:hypothetical protein
MDSRSMYGQFQTDVEREKKGIIIDYGPFRVTVARAGGANKRYQRSLEHKTRPYKRAIQTDTMDNELGQEILQSVYAETVITNWEVQSEGEWVQGIEDSHGDIIAFNSDNVKAAFKDLPDLWNDILQQAQNAALYRLALREEAEGN